MRALLAALAVGVAGPELAPAGAVPPAVRAEVVPTGEQAAFDADIAAAKGAMTSDPVRARSLGAAARLKALAWPASTRRDAAVATAEWIEGEGAYRAHDLAAAGPLNAAALRLAEKVVPASKLNADLLLSRARLRREAGQPQNALADFQRAYNMFVRLRDVRSEAKTLQSIGSIYQDAQDYEHVLYYYRLANELAANDPLLSLSASNNLSFAYFHLGRTREAALASQRSLELVDKLQSPPLKANVLVNFADLAIENKNYAGARNALAAGFRLVEKSGVASWRPMLLGTRAKLELALGRLDEAQRDVAAALVLIDSSTDQSFSVIHLTAYRVYTATGDARRALTQLEIYRRADEEGRALAASTNAALMTARFDFANQNSRIATLKTGQLSRDVALTRLRARQSTVIFSSVVILLMTLLVFLFVYLRSVRRNRAEIMRTNAQLAQSNVELGDALQAKSQFLATTSHEIRTPLNGILGMTQVILADRGLAGGVRERIVLVDAAGRAMRALVDDILDFAKMDSGIVRLDSDAVDLPAAMHDAVSLWQVQAQDKGIALNLSLAGIDRPLVTDVARLRQVVFNLLSNAIKFTARGAVTVDIRAEPDETVVIAVSDTGIGIAPAAFESIFEPFRQLDTSTTRQFGGTGLGLAISRHLARVLGGDITVGAAAGGGSTFALRLPYPAVATADRPPVVPATIDVLVASDNPIRRSFLRTALEGDFAAAACDIPDLATCLAADRVGVVLLDAAAADAVAEGLAAVAATRPVVVLTPAGLDDHHADWAAAGAARLVVKPLQVAALGAILRDQLALRDAGPPPPVAFRAELP